MVVGARQSFQFLRQITWFLGNNRTLSKFRYRILHNLINQVIKNHSVKANFKLTTQATLTKFSGNRRVISLSTISVFVKF